MCPGKILTFSPFISSTLSFIRTRSLGDLGKDSHNTRSPGMSNIRRARGGRAPFLSHSLISTQICTSSALPATLLIRQYLHSTLWNRLFSKSSLLSFSEASFTSGSDARSFPCSLSKCGSFLLHQSGLVVGEATSLLFPESCLSSSKMYSFKVHTLRLLYLLLTSAVTYQPEKISPCSRLTLPHSSPTSVIHLYGFHTPQMTLPDSLTSSVLKLFSS